jgi:hypothetical protein
VRRKLNIIGCPSRFSHTPLSCYRNLLIAVMIKDPPEHIENPSLLSYSFPNNFGKRSCVHYLEISHKSFNVQVEKQLAKDISHGLISKKPEIGC